MNITLKALSMMLTYPRKELIDSSQELSNILCQKESKLPKANQKEIQIFLKSFSETSLLNLQENYVDLFDRTPSLSLHLFEHVHGDSRKRGQAMVDLIDIYKENELDVTVAETPDYLPMFLEYLSLIDEKEAKSNLSDIVDILAAVGARLDKRKTGYAAIFNGLIALSPLQPDTKTLKSALKLSEGSLPDNEQLDTEWAEIDAFESSIDAPAQGGDSCPIAKEMLDRMNIPLKSSNPPSNKE